MKIKALVGAGVAAAALAMTSMAGAVVLFDGSTGAGYIGRGDVIDHPDLGKDALSAAPTVSFAGEAGHWTQLCQKDGGEQKTFKQGATISANVDSAAKKAKGNDNIAGYRLTGYQGGTPALGTAPARVCPVNGAWNTAVGDVYFVAGGAGAGELVFNGNGYTGSWVYDADANDGAGAWVAS